MNESDYKILRKRQKDLAKQIKKLEEIRNRAPLMIKEAHFRKSHTIPPPDDLEFQQNRVKTHHVNISAGRRSEWGEALVLISKLILIMTLISLLYYWWTVIQ